MNKIIKFIFINIIIFNFYIFSTEFAPESWDIFPDLPDPVVQYFKSLPKISDFCTEASFLASDDYIKAKIIADFLLSFKEYKKNDYGFEVKGYEEFIQKIENLVKYNKPIKRFFTGFPVSTANPDKNPFNDEHAFGLADLVALLTRYHIAHEIGKVYVPGSPVFIFFESFIFKVNEILQNQLGADLFPKSRLNSYQNTFRSIIKEYLFPYVQIGKLKEDKDMFETYLKYESMSDEDLAVFTDIKKLESKYKDFGIFYNKDMSTDVLMDKAQEKLFNQDRAHILKILSKSKTKDFINKIKDLPFDKFKESVGSKFYDSKLAPLLSYKKLILESARDVGRYISRAPIIASIMFREQVEKYHEMIRESATGNKEDITEKIGTGMIVGVDGMPWQNILIVDFQNYNINLNHFENVKKNPNINFTKEIYRFNEFEFPYIKVN